MLDAKNPASKGLAEKALRAINPAAAKNEGDAAARDARAKKLLGEMFKGEEIKGKNIVPGLGERWGRPIEQQLAIAIPNDSFPVITEKIVRGLAYREDEEFIEPSQKIECRLAAEEGLEDVKDLLAKHGKEFKREPGLVVRRARSAAGDLYEITFWDQFKTYAIVSKPKAPPGLSPRQRRALRRARLNAWLQRRAAKRGRPKARARRRARKRARRRLDVRGSRK